MNEQVQDVRYICMPLKVNVPIPRDNWDPTVCPICGAECWEQNAVKEILDLNLNYKAVCTLCALRMGK